MSIASERINKIAKLINAKTYLEIGVAEGHTFHDVQIEHKTAVDPNFLFDISAYSHLKRQFYYNMKSDDFFDEIGREISGSLRDRDFTWDVVYIDGLHVYQQTMADFVNSFKYTTDRTIWIFDDTVPSDPWAAIPNMDQCYFFRQMAGVAGWDWQGDVYKCVFEIHDFFNEFSYATVIGNGNPQTIVWKVKDSQQRPRIFRDASEVGKLDYFNMLPRCAALHPMSEEASLAAIGTEVNIPMREGSSFLPFLVKPLTLLK